MPISLDYPNQPQLNPKNQEIVAWLLWGAYLVAIGLYHLVARVGKLSHNFEASPYHSYGLWGIATVTIIIIGLLGVKIRAMGKDSQQGFSLRVVQLGLAEASAIYGLVITFGTSDLWFLNVGSIIAVFFILLLYPKS